MNQVEFLENQLALEFPAKKSEVPVKNQLATEFPVENH